MNEDSNRKYCCPACDRDIVNRNVDRCLYCGEAIPQELLFTEEEVRKNEKAYEGKIREIEEGRQRKKLMESGGHGGSLSGGFGGFSDSGDSGGGE
jgi:hypothetical protein